MKGNKYCITITKEDINTWVASLILARNKYIDEGKAVDDTVLLPYRLKKMYQKTSSAILKKLTQTL